MKCLKCHNNFYINLKTGMLVCLNKRCNYTSRPSNILWTCSICHEDFKSGAIPFNPLDLEIIKKVIKQTLFQKQRAHPYKVPCCNINVFFTEFHHKKRCPGSLYFGELNNDAIIVCDKCHAINFYDRFIWTCPKCGNTFKDEKEKDNNINDDISERTLSIDGRKKNEFNNIDKDKSNDEDKKSYSKYTNRSHISVKSSNNIYDTKSLPIKYYKSNRYNEKNADVHEYENKSSKDTIKLYKKIYTSRYKSYIQNNDTEKEKEKENEKEKEKEKEKENLKNLNKNEKVVEEVGYRRYRKLRINMHNDDKEREKQKELEKQKEKEVEKQKEKEIYKKRVINEDLQNRKNQKSTSNESCRYRQRNRRDDPDIREKERKEREEREKQMEKERDERERKRREERERKRKEEREERERIEKQRKEKEMQYRREREEKRRKEKEDRERKEREEKERKEREEKERKEREEKERKEREEKRKKEKERKEREEKERKERERKERDLEERNAISSRRLVYYISHRRGNEIKELSFSSAKQLEEVTPTKRKRLDICQDSKKKEKLEIKEDPKKDEEEREIEEDDTKIRKNRNRYIKTEDLESKKEENEENSSFKKRWNFRRPEPKKTYGKEIKEETTSTSHSNNNNTDKTNNNSTNKTNNNNNTNKTNNNNTNKTNNNNNTNKTNNNNNTNKANSNNNIDKISNNNIDKINNNNTNSNEEISHENKDNKTDQDNSTGMPLQKIPGMSESLLNHVYKRINHIISKCSIPLMTVEDYTLNQKIGEGSYGIIFRVIGKKDKKQYALKKIISHKLKQIGEFTKEFELVHSCEHENIMKIYSYCIRILDATTYALYVLMELSEGDWDKEIKKKLSQGKNYTEKELVNILYQLASALLYIQDKFHISHRDIKPQNVLIFPDGKYKLADFGEAKEAKVSRQINTLRGTELYMSPALYDGLKHEKNDVNHNPFKSDVFSLGFCFLYASALNFNLLYEVRDILDSQNINVILHKFLNNFYSEKLIKLIGSMLEIDESKRFDFANIKEYIEENFPEMINVNNK